MLKKTISSVSNKISVSAIKSLSANGPFQLRVGTGVLAFCGADAAMPFYPSQSHTPTPNAFTLILNVAGRSGRDIATDTIKYIRLNESDVNKYKEIAKDYFPQVQQILTQGGRVLIHCQEGLTRSVTLVALYLITHGHLSTENALKQVSQLNSQVRPCYPALPSQVV